jgi:hypothetical protein
MNAAPNKAVIQDVALELGINPAFVEKDWYVVQLLKIINGIDLLGTKSIFTGGTALAKAHRLLERFSEDIDFRLLDPIVESLSRSERRKRLSRLKRLIHSTIVHHLPNGGNQLKARDENRFFSIEVEYPSQFAPSEALRSHVLIEFTVTGLSLPPILLPVSSFITQLTRTDPEITAIPCIDPVETAIDKMSALLWRVPDRVREPQDDDPDLVRHIHDLVALHERATAHPNFKRLTIDMIARDDDRCTKTAGWPLRDKMAILMDTLEKDGEYVAEYNRFVQGMSYASGKVPSFEEAIKSLKELTNHLLEPGE